MTLEQITTTGTIVSQIVMPETTAVVNGVTEYAISSEYGSSSEGTLELSADGKSLVIAGYGVNPEIFNEGGAAVYGTAAEAQSTSILGGQYTAVPRVIADINTDGVVDTSTALYDIFNNNNPRSVATVDGSSFYISGQGVKGDTTQGVFTHRMAPHLQQASMTRPTPAPPKFTTVIFTCPPTARRVRPVFSTTVRC